RSNNGWISALKCAEKKGRASRDARPFLLSGAAAGLAADTGQPGPMTAFCGHANTSLVTDRRRCLPDRPEPGRDVLSHRSCARPPVFRRPRALFGGRWPDGKVLSDEWVRGSCVLEPDGGRNDADQAVGTDPAA